MLAESDYKKQGLETLNLFQSPLCLDVHVFARKTADTAATDATKSAESAAGDAKAHAQATANDLKTK